MTRITQPELSLELMPIYEKILEERGITLDSIDPLTGEMLAVAESRLTQVLNHIMELNA